MKIIDGLQLPGWCVEIPDCGRDDFPEFFKELGIKVGAEIGVEQGYYAEVLCKGGLKLYAIDPWLKYSDYVLRFPQQKHNRFEAEARTRLAPYPDCTIIKKTSMEAVQDFEDGSLDFVYIDGNHSFKYVVEDIFEWTKKVRKGGIISGHDYIILGRRPFYCDVKFVLDAYTKALRLKKWYILGKRFVGKRDKARSWFWFNE